MYNQCSCQGKPMGELTDQEVQKIVEEYYKTKVSGTDLIAIGTEGASGKYETAAKHTRILMGEICKEGAKKELMMPAIGIGVALLLTGYLVGKKK